MVLIPLYRKLLVLIQTLTQNPFFVYYDILDNSPLAYII